MKRNAIYVVKKLILVLLPLLSTIALTINLDKKVEFIDSFNCGTISFVIMFSALIVLYYKSSLLGKSISKKGKIIAFLLASIYSIIDVVWFTYNKYNESVFEINYVIKALLRYFGLLFVFYNIITACFYFWTAVAAQMNIHIVPQPGG